ISGASEAVDAVRAALKEQGKASVRLAVSSAFHSPLVEPVLEALEDAAAAGTHAPPPIRPISSLTRAPVTAEERGDAAYWRARARQPVRFAAGLRTLVEPQCAVLLEVGPQAVLTRLARQCLRERAPTCLRSLHRGGDDWQTMLNSLARL